MGLLELSLPELEVLAGIVTEWLADGFTTPPYDDEVYSIIEKLNIHNDSVWDYDLRRPEKGTGGDDGKGTKQAGQLGNGNSESVGA